MSDEASPRSALANKLLRRGLALLRRVEDGATQNGNIDHVADGIIVGWVKKPNDDKPQFIDILLDDIAIVTGLRADQFRRDVAESGLGNGRFGFACRVPADMTLEQATVVVRLSSSKEQLLQKVITRQMLQPGKPGAKAATASSGRGILSRLYRGGLIRKPAGAEGKLEELTADGMRGWAVDPMRPDRTFDIEILLDGAFLTSIRNEQPRGDLLHLGKSGGLGGFRLDLALNELEPGTYTVAAVVPDGPRLTDTVTIKGDVRRYPLNAGLAPINLSEVSVIVPIYNAADDLRVCIDRLRKYSPADLEILLIDDASPDPRIAGILNAVSDMSNVRIQRNEANLGFTRTINRGLVEIGRKHAILLNSDARVTPDWVEGMLRAAVSRPRVATVTAMSDRAGAFSAPRFGNDNALRPGVDEITYARAFRRRSLGLYPVVPTGNGFCMFVNRDCIDEIGTLDADAFPRGYGEENDFCMRAGRAGWSHLIDDRTYVFHDRSKSFGDTKTKLMAAGREIINQRYPEYKKAIRVFSEGSDIALARLRAQQALTDCAHAQAGLPAILYVVATQIGGTPQTNMDLMREISDEIAPWLLHCDSRKMTLSRLEGGDMVDIRTHQLSEPVDPISHRSGEYDAVMRDWLEIANPSVVHIRHIAWHSISLPALAKARGSRVVFSFHDFYTLCPTVKLMDERGVFCGGTCTTTEGECPVDLWRQEDLPPLKNAWVHPWRQRFAEVLKDCDAYVTTSDSARKRIEKHLGLDPQRFHVIPHGRSFTKMENLRRLPKEGERVRILLPGNINKAKGLDVITDLLEYDVEGRLEFHVLGDISHADDLKRYDNLILHGSYKRDEFAQRVERIGPHLGAVFSIWDETYCHTLTELWSTGLPALVFDFPTVAGRVRASGAGWIVPHKDIPALYGQILAISSDQAEQARADRAVLCWQHGIGVGRTTKVMAAGYRKVYASVTGRDQARPLVAVVGLDSADHDTIDLSTEIRLWERTINAPTRDCIFVRMSAESLLANIRDGIVDLAILQRNVIPPPMASTLMQEMDMAGIRYVLDLDDDLFNVPAEKDPDGEYAAYTPVLNQLVHCAAQITVSTERLHEKIVPHNPRTLLQPNRLSERLWRGDLPERENDGLIRALYMGARSDQADFGLIAAALEEMTTACPNFRVGIIGAQEDDLPQWAERIVIPPEAKSYTSFVPWLKGISANFDFGLAPLIDEPFNLFKSNLKALDYGGLGLPVLAADMAVYQPLAGTIPGLTLVSNETDAWKDAIRTMIEQVRAGEIDRDAIRRAVFERYGLESTLPAFDEMLRALARNGSGSEMMRRISGSPGEAA